MKKALLSVALVLITYTHLFAFLTEGHFRWRNNNGSETSATWKANQDSAIKITDFKAIRLRVEIYNSNTTVKNNPRDLQYATSTNGPWYTITNASQINAFVFGGNNGYIANNDSTTQQITDPGYAFLKGNVVTAEDPYSDSIPASKRREYEWCIKPTGKITANTTYYFRANIGSTPNEYPILTTSGPAFTPAAPALLTNGGFEDNLTNWATSTTNSSSATFNVNTTALQVHTGTKALKIIVANTGTASNSVNLTSSPLALADTGTYMLRFWALSTKRNAFLDINLKGATIDNTCHYQIYNRFDTTKNGWQMYQYAFKIAQSPVNLQMSFNTAATYYLDDVEIINEKTNPNVDVRTQYDWQNNFDETFGWQSGDNGNPVVIPDGRTVYVYNDSNVGPIDPHSNVIDRRAIINNLLEVQSGDKVKSIYGGSQASPQNLFSPNNGNQFWNAGGVVEGGQLKTVLIEIRNSSDYTGSTWIGTLSLPDLTKVSLHKLPATITTPPNCIFQDGAYNYLYFGASSQANETHTVVGRVPAGQLDSQVAWQFYTGNHNWSTDFNQAINIVPAVSAANVLKIGPNNYAMSGVPYLSSEVSVWFASSPEGPWVSKTVIYNIPQEEGILPYEGHMTPLGNNGVYSFSYSLFPFVNEPDGSSGEDAMQRSDKGVYLPCYAKANLLVLSPFTAKAPANYITSVSTPVSQGRQLTQSFATSLPNESHITIQQSSNGSNWSDMVTVDSTNKTTNAYSYAAVMNNPKNGLNYFRMELFDQDNVLTITPVRGFTIQENSNISSFTATAVSTNKVNIAFSTSSEYFNEGFIVQSSVDSINWVNLTEIQGAGTVLQTNNYQAVDNNPVLGFNYYRIGHYAAGSPAASSVRKVDTRNPGASSIVLNVYPNPSTSNVNFNLKGYQGKTFTATLTSLFGKQLGKQIFAAVANGTYTLPTNASTGTYVLNIQGSNFAKTTTVLVK